VANEGASRSDGHARTRRAIVTGFLVGFGIAIPATLLALLFDWTERLLPIVVHGPFLVGLSRYLEH
jgi:ABC-type nitrate/sulfonate/bicarbonate transport system permease component